MPKRFLNVEYSGTRTEVGVSDAERLGEVQDAIKSKLSNALAQVDAPQLQLYDQRGQHITDLDDIPDDYYKKPKNGGLFLVIRTTPPPSRQPTKVLLASFPPCEIPFYNNILKAAEEDRWLVFADNIPSTTLNRLYVRESYQSIATDIHTPAQHFQHPVIDFLNHPPSKQRTITKAIITGTPGIGKSLFLFYLLWQLVKKGKRVLFLLDPHNIYYDGQCGVFRFASGRLPLDDDYSFWNGDLWCLFDAKGKEERDVSALPYSICTFVLSTSPRREMINDFKKPPQPQVFYMPIWTKPELDIIAPKFPNAADWSNRFDILGGIPRHVLEVTSIDSTQLLQAACKQCDLNDCIKIIGLNSTITDKSKAVHSLVHVTSTSPFTDSSVTYASQTALDIIVANKGVEAKRKMAELLASCEGNPLTAALCGYIFEPYAMDLLERGGTFTCRQLAHGNTRNLPHDTELVIPQSTRIVADKPESNHTTNQLYVPKTKNYTAIDAWIPGIGAFQMTVGKQHDIKGGAKNDLEKLGPGANKLYWLLPPLYYRSFTKKTPQDIDQYAVRIPYPSAED